MMNVNNNIFSIVVFDLISREDQFGLLFFVDIYKIIRTSGSNCEPNRLDKGGTKNVR